MLKIWPESHNNLFPKLLSSIIFEKYERVTTSSEGNGVCLYLLKEMLERSGGKTAAKSVSRTGSEFSIF